MPSDPTTERYTFGDTALAAQRLERVALVFEDASRDWLGRTRPEQVRLAYDLGCGPGASTRLMADVSGAASAVGLDFSEAFIGLCSRNRDERIDFLRWNVEQVPFPKGPADLIYARLLLAHLKDPAKIVKAWGTQLRTGGRVILDELERIDTTEATFKAYLDLAHARVALGGAELYAGPILRSGGGTSGLRLIEDRILRYPVRSSDAASMFSMNLTVWGADAVREGLLDELALASLSGALAELRSSAETGAIVWYLHQSSYCPR